MEGQRPPWAGGGTAGGICCNFRFSTFFSRETGGSKKGIPPWRDKGAANATSCYSAFLCLPSFLAKRGFQEGYPPLAGQGRGKRHVLLLRFSLPTCFSRETGVPRRLSLLGGTRARQTPRPVTPLFFAYLLFSQKRGGSKGDIPTPLFFAYLLFSQKRGGSKGDIPPWQDKGAASATSRYSAFLCLLAFLAETRGIQGGYPPWRDKGAASATSRYSAFLCLLSFLVKRK